MFYGCKSFVGPFKGKWSSSRNNCTLTQCETPAYPCPFLSRSLLLRESHAWVFHGCAAPLLAPASLSFVGLGSISEERQWYQLQENFVPSVTSLLSLPMRCNEGSRRCYVWRNFQELILLGFFFSEYFYAPPIIVIRLVWLCNPYMLHICVFLLPF